MQGDDEQRTDERPPPLPEQRPLDFLRGEQLRLLQDCQLPRVARDRQGHGVRAAALKMVLTAIDNYGRGRPGGAYASVETLAKSANVAKRTATRAVEVLQTLGLICVENDERRWGRRGSPTNRYTIVWSELALRCDRGLLSSPARGEVQSAPGRADHRAPASDQSALGTDQSALGTDQSALGTDQSALGGALNGSKRFEALQEAPSVVGGDEVGARFFSGDEMAAIREKANQLNVECQARSADDRQLVLKIATLWAGNELTDDMVLQSLESFERKREAGDPVRNGCAWIQTCLVNQCIKHRLRFDRLLATTDFPRELLPPPAARPLQPR